MSIVGGIQPGILRQAIGREHMQDGLCARLLLASPEERPVRWSDAVVSASTTDGMDKLLDCLLAIESGADAEGNPEAHPLPLTPAAKSAWVEYYNRHRGEMAHLDEDLAAAWSKLEAYTARFALIFQLCRNADSGAVDEHSIVAAVVVSDWFGHEAKRVYGILREDDEDRGQRELVEWIRRCGGRTNPRDLRGQFGGDTDLAEQFLMSLVKQELGEWQIEPTGGRPRRDFVLYQNNQNQKPVESGETEPFGSGSFGCESENEEDQWTG